MGVASLHPSYGSDRSPHERSDMRDHFPGVASLTRATIPSAMKKPRI